MDSTHQKLEKEIVEHIEHNGFYLAGKLIKELPKTSQRKYKEMLRRKMEESEEKLFPLTPGI